MKTMKKKYQTKKGVCTPAHPFAITMANHINSKKMKIYFPNISSTSAVTSAMVMLPSPLRSPT